jgi:hypothetical protein
MFKSAMGSTGIGIIRPPELLDSSQPLKSRMVDDLSLEVGEAYEPVDRATDF